MLLVVQSCSTLQPHGLQPTRLLCAWDFPGKNTGLFRHFLPQGIFPTQGSNLGLLHCRQILYCLSHQGSHLYSNRIPQFSSLTPLVAHVLFQQHPCKPADLELSLSCISGYFIHICVPVMGSFIFLPSSSLSTRYVCVTRHHDHCAPVNRYQSLWMQNEYTYLGVLSVFTSKDGMKMNVSLCLWTQMI